MANPIDPIFTTVTTVGGAAVAGGLELRRQRRARAETGEPIDQHRLVVHLGVGAAAGLAAGLAAQKVNLVKGGNGERSLSFYEAGARRFGQLKGALGWGGLANLPTPLPENKEAARIRDRLFGSRAKPEGILRKIFPDRLPTDWFDGADLTSADAFFRSRTCIDGVTGQLQLVEANFDAEAMEHVWNDLREALRAMNPDRAKSIFRDVLGDACSKWNLDDASGWASASADLEVRIRFALEWLVDHRFRKISTIPNI